MGDCELHPELPGDAYVQGYEVSQLPVVKDEHVHDYFAISCVPAAQRLDYHIPPVVQPFPPYIEPDGSVPDITRDPLRKLAPFVLACTVYHRPRILDYGSGDGFLSQAIKTYIERSSVVPYDGSVFSASPFSGLTLSDLKTKFDVIVLNQVLHHLVCRDPIGWARQLSSLLGPMGIIVVREDIWNGTVGHWNDLNSAHDKYHDNMNSACFTTRNHLIRTFAAAGLMMLPVLPPDDYPLLRARGYRGQVYHFCADTTKSMSVYYGVLKRLTANYQRLQNTMYNARKMPDDYGPLYAEGNRPGPLHLSYLSYMRDNPSKYVTQVEELQKYGMTRFMGQPDTRWTGSTGSEAYRQQLGDEKYVLLTIATLVDNSSAPVALEQVLRHMNSRPDTQVIPTTRVAAKLAIERLIQKRVIQLTGKQYSPGPEYTRYLTEASRYPSQSSEFHHEIEPPSKFDVPNKNETCSKVPDSDDDSDEDLTDYLDPNSLVDVPSLFSGHWEE